MIVLTLVNLVGVRLFARVNNVAVFCEIVSTLVIALIVAIAALAKPASHTVSLFNTNGVHGSAIWGAVVGAMVMGFFALTGFEAAADMSEESVGARRAIPRAVIWSLVGTGLFGMIALICFASAVPTGHMTAVAGSYTPVYDVVSYWLGSTGARVALAFPLVAVLGTCLSVVAVMGRLIFALARDNVVPFSEAAARRQRQVAGADGRPCGRLAARHRHAGLCLLPGQHLRRARRRDVHPAVRLLPADHGRLRVQASRLEAYHVPGMSPSGKWSKVVFGIAFVWLIAALLMLTLQPMFHQADIAVLGTLGVGVVWYVAALHWRIKAGTPARRRTAQTAPRSYRRPSLPGWASRAGVYRCARVASRSIGPP